MVALVVQRYTVSQGLTEIVVVSSWVSLELWILSVQSRFFLTSMSGFLMRMDLRMSNYSASISPARALGKRVYLMMCLNSS